MCKYTIFFFKSPTDSNFINFSNLDPLTETYGLSFYMQYLAHWPEYFQVAESPSGEIMGYSTLKNIFISIHFVLGLQMLCFTLRWLFHRKSPRVIPTKIQIQIFVFGMTICRRFHIFHYGYTYLLLLNIIIIHSLKNIMKWYIA